MRFLTVAIAIITVREDLWYIFFPPIIVRFFVTKFSKDLSVYYNKLCWSFFEKRNQVMWDSIKNYAIVRAFGKASNEVYECSRLQYEAHKNEKYHGFIETGITTFSSLFSQGVKIYLVLFCMNEIMEGKMTVGELNLLLTYQGMLNGSVEVLTQVYKKLHQEAIRVNELLEIVMSEDTKAIDMGKKMPRLQKSIEIQNLSFSYQKLTKNKDGTKTKSLLPPCLKNINLSIPAGKVTAFCGFSGSGSLFYFGNPTFFSQTFPQENLLF